LGVAGAGASLAAGWDEAAAGLSAAGLAEVPLLVPWLDDPLDDPAEDPLEDPSEPVPAD
jgi:hypothetical protein